jgi:hypothetical protein
MFHPDKLRKEHQTAGAEWFKLCTQVHGIVDHLGKMEPSNLQDYLEQAKAQAEAQALSDSCVQLLCAEPCSLETARKVAHMLIDHGEQRAAAAAAPGAAASGLGETKLGRIIRAGVDRLVSQFERLAAEALPTDSRAKAQASLSSHASDASDASDASRWVSCSLCWRELVLDAHDRIATLTAWFLAQVLGDSGDSSAAQQQQQCSLARQVLQHIDLAGGQRVPGIWDQRVTQQRLQDEDYNNSPWFGGAGAGAGAGSGSGSGSGSSSSSASSAFGQQYQQYELKHNYFDAEVAAAAAAAAAAAPSHICEVAADRRTLPQIWEVRAHVLGFPCAPCDAMTASAFTQYHVQAWLANQQQQQQQQLPFHAAAGDEGAMLLVSEPIVASSQWLADQAQTVAQQHFVAPEYKEEEDGDGFDLGHLQATFDAFCKQQALTADKRIARMPLLVSWAQEMLRFNPHFVTRFDQLLNDLTGAGCCQTADDADDVLFQVRNLDVHALLRPTPGPAASACSELKGGQQLQQQFRADGGLSAGAAAFKEEAGQHEEELAAEEAQQEEEPVVGHGLAAATAAASEPESTPSTEQQEQPQQERGGAKRKLDQLYARVYEEGRSDKEVVEPKAKRICARIDGSTSKSKAATLTAVPTRRGKDAKEF